MLVVILCVIINGSVNSSVDPVKEGCAPPNTIPVVLLAPSPDKPHLAIAKFPVAVQEEPSYCSVPAVTAVEVRPPELKADV